jgi:thioredoxin-related protein
MFFVLGLLTGVPAAAQANVPSPHAIEIPKWFAESFLDIRDDIRDASREGKRLMIYFGQDGCPYCKAIMKVNFGDPAIAATTRRHFVPIAINIWGDREVTWIDGRRMPEKELAQVLRVQYTPTLLFFDEEGAVALRVNGFWPPERFRVALDYASQRKEREQAFADFEAGRAPATGAMFTRDARFASGAADLPKALAAGRPVMVLFERAGCAECAELHREAFARPEVRKFLDRFTRLQVDARGSASVVAGDGTRTTEREWARRLNVVGAPTMVFFERGGAEVFRVEGYLRPFHIAAVLDYVASDAWRTEPSYQRFLQHRTEAMRAAGQPVDLWK